MAPASSKLTQPVIFSSHQLCGFLCHLLEPASYLLWLCVFRDIWHLKESEAKVGMAEIHSKERHIGLPLQTRRINNGQAALTPGELLRGFPEAACSLPAQLPHQESSVTLSGLLQACDCPHMSHNWAADASPY